MMKRTLTTLSAAIVLLFSMAVASAHAATPAEVQHYAVFYGAPDAGRIEELKKFDLAVVAPELWTPEQVQAVKQNGTIVLGYSPSLVVNKANPEFSGLLSTDYLVVNGQRVETVWGSTTMSLLDPRSSHVWGLIRDHVKSRIYSKGMDGVFLDGLNIPSEFLDSFVSLDPAALQNLKQELFAGTGHLIYTVKYADTSKYIGQNNGWRELEGYTGPYLNFLFWSDYPYELGDTDEWLNARRSEVLAFKEAYGVVPLAYRVINPADAAAVAQFYNTVRSQGLIPYAVPGSYTTVNTYGLTGTEPPAPPPTEPPTTEPPATDSRLPHAVNSFIEFLGDPTPDQLEEIKKFDLAVVGPELSDAKLKVLKDADVIVLAYMATTSIDQRYPYYTGLWEQDYLWVNGQKVVNYYDASPDWLMDPRSAHYRQVVVDTIKRDVFNRGFDGVYLDTLNQVAEYLQAYVSLDPTTLNNLKTELMLASAQLAKEIYEAGAGKLVAQNNGWIELVNYTAPYIDFLMWEDYPYDLGTSDQWLNLKRNNLIGLRDQYDFIVLAVKFINWYDYAAVDRFYADARSYGFVPYAPWTSGVPVYNTINTYDLPPRSYTPVTPPSEPPATEPPPTEPPATEPPATEPPATEPPPTEPPSGVPTKTPAEVQHYAVFYGAPDAGRIEELKKFDLAVVAPELWTPEQVQAVKQNGTIVLGYSPSLVVNKANPEFSGLLSTDYLVVNGQRVETVWGSTTMSLLDPRSSHVWGLIRDHVKSRIYSKGMDGVFLDGLNIPSEFLDSFVSLDPAALQNLKQELFAGTGHLIYTVKYADTSKYIGQNNGWRELEGYTGPYLNFLFWSDYPYELGDTDEWLNARRSEVLAFKEAYGVIPLAYRVINPADAAAVAQFYNTVRSQGLIPYAVPGSYTTVNTYGLTGTEPPAPPPTEPPATEPPAPPPDTAAPSTPSLSKPRALSSSSVALSWTPATDNVGVDHYDVYRGTLLFGSFTKIASVQETSFTDSGLKPRTRYYYYVKAVDAAGNVSEKSNTGAVRTFSK